MQSFTCCKLELQPFSVSHECSEHFKAAPVRVGPRVAGLGMQLAAAPRRAGRLGQWGFELPAPPEAAAARVAAAAVEAMK